MRNEVILHCRARHGVAVYIVILSGRGGRVTRENMATLCGTPTNLFTLTCLPSLFARPILTRAARSIWATHSLCRLVPSPRPVVPSRRGDDDDDATRAMTTPTTMRRNARHADDGDTMCAATTTTTGRRWHPCPHHQRRRRRWHDDGTTVPVPPDVHQHCNTLLNVT